MADCIVSVTAEGDWTYSTATDIINALREHSIECGVTTGGIWMTFDLQVHGNTVLNIIRSNGGSFCRETSLMRNAEEVADRFLRDQCISLIKRMWGEE